MECLGKQVIYQIYPKSFKDSDGDGIGDLRGITEKLGYLALLGVDMLWITPFFPSPQKDNGYDVADYLQVDPRFGTMADLEDLIAQAAAKKIGIMLDMVFNHTSTEHAWFRRAMNGDPDYMDYYIFRDGDPERPPTNWQSKFGGSSWEYVPHLKKWYLHLFDKTQADLNWENPRVRNELKDIVRFWVGKGIRGFRFDVVNLISKPDVFRDDLHGDGRGFYTDGPRVHAYLKELVRDTGIASLVTVGEMSSTSIAHGIRYSNPAEQELSMCFNFHHLKIDYKDGQKWEMMMPDLAALQEILTQWQVEMQEAGGWNAVFWCNHDQPRIVSRLGDDRAYWRASATMLATAVLLLRGTPYIYQGEELGMTNAYFTDIAQYRDVESRNYYEIMRTNGKSEAEALAILAARSRDNSRTPMQWSDAAFAGFSTHTPWISLSASASKIHAEDQIHDDDSVFTYFRRLIQYRKEKSSVFAGKIAFLPQTNPAILAYRRYVEDAELLVVCNFSGQTAQANIGENLDPYRRILGNYADSVFSSAVTSLQPYEAVVLEKTRQI